MQDAEEFGCSRCGEFKELEQYGTYADRKYDPPKIRRFRKCRACRSQLARAWNVAHKARHAASGSASQRNPRVRRRRRAKMYGLSEWELAALEAASQGHCWLCGRFAGEDRLGLHVDHNHATGRVRGLLCGQCNIGLGAFGDDPIRLLKAATYLTRSADGVFADSDRDRARRNTHPVPG